MDPSALKSPIEIGSRLGDYVVTERLGAGGMCEVFKGIDPMLERYVAIKVMLKELQTPEALKDFLDEARVIARMMHSNIVPLYSVGEIEGIPWLAMGFIEGPNLEMYLYEKGSFSLAEGERFLRQAVSALAYAAKSNVIHLDIKPANFILDPQGEILLADFGVARKITEVNSGMLDNQELQGTPSYASPEHIRQLKPDLRTDIYCLGVTIFQLLTGELPFEAEDTIEVCKMHLFKAFPTEILEKYNIPTGWCNLIRKMMEKKPEDRFQKYSEIVEALDSIEHFTGVKMAVAEPVAPSGRYYLPRTGGSPEDLFYFLPHELVTKGQDVFRLGQPYSPDSVLETLDNRWTILKINTMTERLIHLQSQKGEDVDDTLWALARITQYDATIQGLSEFMAAQEGIEIQNQDERLQLVGLDRARNLAIVARAFYQDWQAARPLNHHNFIEHSVYTGILAGFMADMLSLPTLGMEFATGFLSTIGKLILLELYPSKTVAVWLKAYETCRPLEEIEFDTFGLTNYDIAAFWLKKNKFYRLISSIVDTQLDPLNAFNSIQQSNQTMRLLGGGPSLNKQNAEALSLTTYCANMLARELGLGYSGSPYLELTPWLEQETTKELFKRSHNPEVTYEEFGTFFMETCRNLPELQLTQLGLAEKAERLKSAIKPGG